MVPYLFLNSCDYLFFYFLQSFVESSIWAIFSRKMVIAWKRGHANCITGRRRRGTASCSCRACSASSFTATAAVLRRTATTRRPPLTAVGGTTTASPESVCRVSESASEPRLRPSSLSGTRPSPRPRTAPNSCCRPGSWRCGRAKGEAFCLQCPQNWSRPRCCSEQLGCLWLCPYLYLYLYLCLAAPATTLKW